MTWLSVAGNGALAVVVAMVRDRGYRYNTTEARISKLKKKKVQDCLSAFWWEFREKM